MFRASDIMILNKIDLLPYVQFSSEKCIQYARQVNPGIRVFEVSATTGEGMTAWTRWLKEQRAFNECGPNGRKFDPSSTDGLQA